MELSVRETVSERKKLYFEMLGTFSCGGRTLKAGRKVLSFLQYLLIHHERNISMEELIEEFWPDRSNAPAEALRRMLCKARDLLREMVPEQENLLLTLSGCYAWNPEISLELDTERFEAACLEAEKKQGEERTESLRLAISLYKGDFLPANDSDWSLGPRQYYRALYLDAYKALLSLLEKEEKWAEMLKLCEQAHRIDSAAEELLICQMKALMALGQPDQAAEKYENYRDKMMKEFQIDPSDQAERLYLSAVRLCKKDMEISDVFEILNNGEKAAKGAFFCDFETFRKIVALEKRRISGFGGDCTVAIVRLGQMASSPTDIRRLERILLKGLRSDDPVARLETGAYILMLKGANMEKARLVMSRLDRSFHKTYRHSNANISYHISMLYIEKKEN